MTLNEQLERLYRSKMNGLQAMYSELNKADIKDYSWPLLLHVRKEEYVKAPVKLMVIGQEANGWGATLDHAEEIASSMAVYERFDMGRNYNTTFWRWAHKINRQLGNPDTNCFVWNNILKFGRECEKGCPDSRVTQIENRYFNVIEDEISILRPDVCIFLTGHAYDGEIKSKFPDVELIEFNGYPLKEVAQVKSSNLPVHSYRTYHPGYGQRYTNWYSEVFEIIAKAI